MSNIQPSTEQQLIIDDSSNIVVTAKPGSGKTFTVVEKIENITEELLDYQGVIAISFTKKASNELSKRCKKKNIPPKASFLGTIDGFYVSQIIGPFLKYISRTSCEMKVVSGFDQHPIYGDLKKISEGMTTDLEKLLIKSFKEGIVFLEILGEIAIYIMNKVPDCLKYIKSRYTHIIIDEYQDCGKLQHQFFNKLVEEGLIGIAVGDLDQAIFGFANKDSKYLAELINVSTFTHYEINKNHRCHSTISAYSLNLFGTTIPTIDEKSRVFKVTVNGNESDIAHQIDKNIKKIMEKYEVENLSEVAILCRGNANASRISEFLTSKNKLFRETDLDKSSTYWGRIFNEILQCYFDKNIYAIDLIERYYDEEIDSHEFRKGLGILNNIFKVDYRELKKITPMFKEFAELIYPDYFNEDTYRILDGVLHNTNLLLSYKPAENDEINVLTLHKSKGLEFDVVFHLDLYKWIFPFENITDSEYMQALNLHYVGVTRAKKVCYLVQGNKRYRTKQEDYVNAIESPFLYLNNLEELRNNVVWKSI